MLARGCLVATLNSKRPRWRGCTEAHDAGLYRHHIWGSGYVLPVSGRLEDGSACISPSPNKVDLDEEGVQRCDREISDNYYGGP